LSQAADAGTPLFHQREMLLRSQARHMQYLQKALTQMNIQLANVISDVVGKTGQKILRAIITAEREPQVRAQMKNVRIHASSEAMGLPRPRGAEAGMDNAARRLLCGVRG